jgi:hypothetical protein
LIPAVLHEWREPRHDAFEARNVWSLFNSVTEALKEGNLNELPKSTEALHGLPDFAVGLNRRRSAIPFIGVFFLLARIKLGKLPTPFSRTLSAREAECESLLADHDYN